MGYSVGSNMSQTFSQNTTCDQDTAGTENCGARRESIVSWYSWRTLPSTPCGSPQGQSHHKARVVYDASARSKRLSLNDCLNSGLKFDQKILDILSHFWVYRVAVTADIEKAFFMVFVSDKDQEFLRFLQMDNPNKNEPKIIAYWFTWVVFGVTASSYDTTSNYTLWLMVSWYYEY